MLQQEGGFLAIYRNHDADRCEFAQPSPERAAPTPLPVWNPPHRPHATLSGDTPFLAVFAWTREVDAPAYILPAGDWNRFEPAPGTAGEPE